MITLGTIPYLNTQPVDCYIHRYKPDICIVRDIPTAINRELISGNIAVGPLSVYELVNHSDLFAVVTDMSITAVGTVQSVLLFSWYADIGELDQRSIALTAHSSTSVRLLHLLCQQRYHISPQWKPMAQNLETMLRACSGALLIGDAALTEGTLRRSIPPHGKPYVFDLCDEWGKLTGLPFTFAVWVVHRDWMEEVRLHGIIPALRASRSYGLTQIETIAKQYAPRLGLSSEICSAYLRNLRYELDSDALEGLYTFLRMSRPDFHGDNLYLYME